jgi:hypothetical protein
MSQEWMALVRQLCTPEQALAVETIALSKVACEPASSTAEVAKLARRFGLSSADADLWSRSVNAASVLRWPGGALDLLGPDGLFEEIGLDDAVAVVDRLARAMVVQSPNQSPDQSSSQSEAQAGSTGPSNGPSTDKDSTAA